MRKTGLAAGALLSAVILLLSANGTRVARAGDGQPPAIHAYISEYTGPETCAECHVSAGQQVVESLHYQQQGPVPYREGWDEELLGGMVATYGVAYASVASINWMGILQPEDESLPAQPDGCAQCHAGLGAIPNSPPTADDLANVDCLICHGPDYERAVVEEEDGRFRFTPAEGVDVLAAAQAAQRPTSEMCDRCHLEASGGVNFQDGEYPTSPEVDVHLAAGLQCVDCHVTEDHKTAGGGTMIAQELPEVEVACEGCHEEPHEGDDAPLLDMHLGRVACQTCHIPLIARDPEYATQMTRDYTRPTLDEATGLYGPQVGLESDVAPTYLWWQGHQMESPSRPVGSIDDPDARITPWKPVEITVPYDAETGTPVTIKQDVYRVTGDLDAAVAAGVEAMGQDAGSSGAWEAVTALIHVAANHQVAPAAESLQCVDCHTEGGRLDFVALGYEEERSARLAVLAMPTPAATATSADEPPATLEPAPTGESSIGGTGTEACLACHGTPGMETELPNGDRLYLSIDAEAYASSVHGSQGYACVQCHTDTKVFPHDPITAASRREFVFQRYLSSCVQCHPENYETTLDSVHQKALAAGKTEAAVCTDCHGAHYIESPDEPVSRGSQMCEQCHSQIYGAYEESVHGAALIDDGNPDVPACTDCHGVHDTEGPHTSEAFHLLSVETCATCHNDPALMDRYGLNADVYDTYVADFHGTTIMLFEAITPDGETNKPVCVDCHGVHDIRPHDDPNSTVIHENLLGTCQRCHPDATVDFPASWLSHYRPDAEETPVVYFVDLFYKVMIPAVIGGMLLFNATDLFRSLADRFKGRKEQNRE